MPTLGVGFSSTMFVGAARYDWHRAGIDELR